MLILNANQLNSLQEIFVTVLILYPTLIFLAFRAYLLEPPPRDYITRRKTKKNQNSNEVKNGCTNSRVRIDLGSIMFNERRKYFDEPVWSSRIVWASAVVLQWSKILTDSFRKSCAISSHSSRVSGFWSAYWFTFLDK